MARDKLPPLPTQDDLMVDMFASNDFFERLHEAVELRIDRAPGEVTPSSYQRDIYRWMYLGEGDALVHAVAGSGKTAMLVGAGAHTQGEETIYTAFGKDIQTVLSARIKALGVKAACSTTYALGYSGLRRAFGGAEIEVDDNKYRKLASAMIAPMALEWAETYHRRRETWMQSKPFNEQHQARWATQEPVPPPTRREAAATLNEILKFARLNLVRIGNPVALRLLLAQYDIQVSSYLLPHLNELLDQLLLDGASMAEQQKVVDYIDMVHLPSFWDLPFKQRKWVIVDEAQDLSLAQIELLFKLKAEDGRMLICGDPDQKIFSFSGASPRAWETLKTMSRAVELPLSICYRCPRSHIRLAQQTVSAIEPRPDAPEGVLETIKHDDISGYLEPGAVVLCRRTAPLVKLCIELMRRRVPARIRGRDIGAGLLTIVDQLGRMEQFHYPRVLPFLDTWEVAALQEIGDADEDEGRRRTLSDRVECLRVCIQAWRDIRSLEQLKKAIEDLFSDVDAQIVLSTVHKFKGDQAKIVLILEHDRMPYEWAQMREWEEDAERCLKYVAETRSTWALYLVMSEER